MNEAELGTGGARRRRAVSAVERRPSSSMVRPFTVSRSRRPYSAYTKRSVEEQGPKYDAPETNREWWRQYVKETPTPGSYKVKDFVDDLHGKHVTYGFRNVGRRPTSARFHSSGEVLLPGAYEHRDFLDTSGKKQVTYNFRSTDRNSGAKIGHGYGDKDVDTSPAWLDLRLQESNLKEKEKNTKDSNYKSRVVRSLGPCPQFPIKEGPGPGLYDELHVTQPSMSSAFKSKVPRFNAKLPKVPGPGAYNISESPFGEPRPLPAVSHYARKKDAISVT